MKLYHGSIEQVVHPEIRKSSRTLDYGTGFYTTTSEQQAAQWVKRKLGMQAPIGYINIYELDETAYTQLNVLRFEASTESWLDFVMNNRTNTSFEHEYDLVQGPVANDRVYAAFALYESGILNKQELIGELKTYRLVDQLLFHTPRSLDFLSFKNTKEVHL